MNKEALKFEVRVRFEHRRYKGRTKVGKPFLDGHFLRLILGIPDTNCTKGESGYVLTVKTQIKTNSAYPSAFLIYKLLNCGDNINSLAVHNNVTISGESGTRARVLKHLLQA